MEAEALPRGNPAGGLRAKPFPEASEAENVPLEATANVMVLLAPAGLPLKRDDGALTVVDQLLVGVSCWVVLGGEHAGCGDVLPARLVTVPGGRGASPFPWSGGATAAADRGTRNRKLGRSRNGIRTAVASFFVILAPKCHVFSLYNVSRHGRPRDALLRKCRGAVRKISKNKRANGGRPSKIRTGIALDREVVAALDALVKDRPGARS